MEEKILKYMENCNGEVAINIIATLVTQTTIDRTYEMLCILEQNGKIINTDKDSTKFIGPKMSKWKLANN
ncbi:hypothetical protein EXN57_02050 [Clostridium botulinum]|nr:hypothetical protein [Clostridium botulinum]NFD33757.1 hypothetical protein [Clostridium botulinum]NFD57856.1 hypothetical protein [Clostridium botulinum]NFE00125.1 hypothetical protein [Clostridium botulinum]